jgi:hypothetical protein
MREAEFRAFMTNENLAEQTKYQRVQALKRIEKAEGVDLENEYDRDGLTSLVSRYTYGRADAAAARPNPTKLDIDQDKLLTHVSWYRSHISGYLKFKKAEVGDFSPPIESEEDVAVASASADVAQTFGLEKDLQTALRASLEDLEPGLVVADGGSEQKVEAGFIDILARDTSGAWVVIELKADVSRPAAVAQVLAYMGCVAADNGGDVRGILVAADHDPRVEFAARAVPNLELKRYRYRFEFN